MRSLPFDKPGRFFRGNLHCHSTRSDGSLDPAAMVAAYRAQGYDFIALTDHFWHYGGTDVTDTRPLRSDAFTTLVAAELHGPGQANGALWHIIAVGLPVDFPRRDGEESGPEIAARAAASGAFVGIAHPHWSGLTLVDVETLDAAHAVEVANATCSLKWDRGDAWYISDLASATGRRLGAYASDDAHFVSDRDAFGAWVQVRAETLAPDALLAALKAGHYYASEGPEIVDIVVTDDQIRIVSDANCTVSVTGGSPGGPFSFGGHVSHLGGSPIHGQHGTVESLANGVVASVFPLDDFAGGFCRVTVVDAAGTRAWSNPIWLD